MKKLFQHIFKAILECTSQEGRIFRYSLSYCFLLALFPSLIIAVIMFHEGLIDMQIVLKLVYQFVPQSFIEPFIEYIVEKEYATGLSSTIALVVSCYMASNCFYSFMLISASEEEFKTYGILIRMKAILVFGLFIISCIIVGYLISNISLHSPFITMTGAFVILYIFYRTLSFAKRCFWYGVPGALFSSITIVFVGGLISDVIRTFTSYQSIYGPLASLATALLAIYIIATIIYFGYCLNNAYDSDCEITGFKSMWFFHKGNRIMKHIESKIPIHFL